MEKQTGSYDLRAPGNPKTQNLLKLGIRALRY